MGEWERRGEDVREGGDEGKLNFARAKFGLGMFESLECGRSSIGGKGKAG